MPYGKYKSLLAYRRQAAAVHAYAYGGDGLEIAVGQEVTFWNNLKAQHMRGTVARVEGQKVWVTPASGGAPVFCQTPYDVKQV